jgi:hypothetical protein
MVGSSLLFGLIPQSQFPFFSPEKFVRNPFIIHVIGDLGFAQLRFIQLAV